MPCTIVGVMETPNGKYPDIDRDPYQIVTGGGKEGGSSKQMTVILEYAHFLETIYPTLP